MIKKGKLSINQLKAQISSLEKLKKEEFERRKLQRQLKLLKQSPQRIQIKNTLAKIGKQTHRRLMIIGDNLERMERGTLRKSTRKLVKKRR